jgi:hypothetical protein
MNCIRNKDAKKDMIIRIPLTNGEQSNFRAYLKANDKKAGAFARTAILAAMERERPATAGDFRGKNGGTP